VGPWDSMATPRSTSVPLVAIGPIGPTRPKLALDSKIHNTYKSYRTANVGGESAEWQEQD
jgi:hypothetical protein